MGLQPDGYVGVPAPSRMASHPVGLHVSSSLVKPENRVKDALISLFSGLLVLAVIPKRKRPPEGDSGGLGLVLPMRPWVYPIHRDRWPIAWRAKPPFP